MLQPTETTRRNRSGTRDLIEILIGSLITDQGVIDAGPLEWWRSTFRLPAVFGQHKLYIYRYVGVGCWFAPIAIRSQASSEG